MIKISFKQKNFEEALQALYCRPSYPPEIEQSVREILADVKHNGNAAIVKYAVTQGWSGGESRRQNRADQHQNFCQTAHPESLEPFAASGRGCR